MSQTKYSGGVDKGQKTHNTQFKVTGTLSSPIFRRSRQDTRGAIAANRACPDMGSLRAGTRLRQDLFLSVSFQIRQHVQEKSGVEAIHSEKSRYIITLGICLYRILAIDLSDEAFFHN